MMFAHPYYFKMWESEDSYGDTKWKKVDQTSEWNGGRTNQMIRYAEVLLIYAEAKAMSGGPDPLAYECINRVRNRAFAGVGSTGKELTPGLNAEAFRDSVFVERGWEFAGFEFANRWFDLVRLKLVEEAAKETPSPEYKYLPGRSSKDWKIANLPTKENYFYPAPEEDALLNPNLK